MEGVFFGVPFEVLSLFELVSSRMSEARVSISSNSCRPMQQAPPVVLRASDLGKQVMTTGWDQNVDAPLHPTPLPTLPLCHFNICMCIYNRDLWLINPDG